MVTSTDWTAIVATALISSFSTACLTEPVKAKIAFWIERSKLRRSLYWEIMNNLGGLLGQVSYSRRDAARRDGIGVQFKMDYQRISYNLALKDPSALRSLSRTELYAVNKHYRNFDQVVHGDFKSGEVRLRNAEFVVFSVISDLKNRNLSKRLAFGESPKWLREHLRGELPSTSYVDISEPRMIERLYRQLDRVNYWMWKKLNLRQGTQSSV